MFPKKKKQDPPEIQTTASVPAHLNMQPGPQAAQSLFAPGLNPSPTQIDFFSSAPPPQFHAEPFPAPQPEFTMEPPPPPMQEQAPDTYFDPDYIPEQAATSNSPDMSPAPFSGQTAMPETAAWESPQTYTAEPLPLAAQTTDEDWHTNVLPPQASDAATWQPAAEVPSYQFPDTEPEPGLSSTAYQGDMTETWQPAEPAHSPQMAGLYPNEAAPSQTFETESWQMPAGMDLPPQVQEIYPQEYAPQTPMPSGDISAETLWHQMQPNFSETSGSVNSMSEDMAVSLEWESESEAGTMVFPTAPEFTAPELSMSPGLIDEAETWSQPINPVSWEPPSPLQQDTPLPAFEAPPEASPAFGEVPGAESYPEDSFGASFQNEPTIQTGTGQNIWDNLQSSAAPGEQVPTGPKSSAHFLDSVSSQLYPEDPFHFDPVSLTEGEQAFEEAAQFLFPETMNAPLEWNDSTEHMAVQDSFQDISLPEAPSLDLGPSYQLEAGSFNDISSVYSEPPEPMAFSTEATVTFQEFTPEIAPLPQEEPVTQTQPLPDLSATFDIPAAAPESQSFFPDTDYSPNELWFAEDETETTVEKVEITPTLDNTGTYDSILGPLEEEADQAMKPVSSPVNDPDSTAAFFEEQDFYTPTYTLDEQDEIVAVHEEYVIPTAEGETGFESLWNPATSSQPATPDADSGNWGLSEMAEEEDIPLYSLELDVDSAQTQPLTPTLTPPDGNLEEAWNLSPVSAPVAEPMDMLAPPAVQPMDMLTPPVAQSVEASSAPATDFSLENLEIIGVCPLEAEKRLLLVRNGETFALMGQAGLQNPNISVLKIFDHNPTAYQNTFTAVEEGQSGNQGMYVVQVGTWHAILSTFQQNILLHTELG